MNNNQNKKSGGFFGKKPRSEFEERIIQVDRVTYVVAGGKRLRFRVLVVIGDRKGRVGYGIGKATEVPESVKKAVTEAKKNLVTIPIINGTIAHELNYHFGAAHIFLKPAKAGTSIIAGGSVRAVLELAGIKNILSKILGTSNKINNVKATIEALTTLRKPEAISEKDIDKTPKPEEKPTQDKVIKNETKKNIVKKQAKK